MPVVAPGERRVYLTGPPEWYPIHKVLKTILFLAGLGTIMVGAGTYLSPAGFYADNGVEFSGAIDLPPFWGPVL